jgi:oxygen-independent coproporphyrinogen-3 oxidase
LTAHTPWTSASEVTFECEPGTLTEAKLDTIRRLGVRASVSVSKISTMGFWKSMDGRTDRPKSQSRPSTRGRLAFRRSTLISSPACWRNRRDWRRNIERTLDLDPDSVTIYAMELPYNTTITSDILTGAGQFTQHVASWDTRRLWVGEAWEALNAPATRSGPRTPP